jgi:hypothetical protein
MKLLPTVLIQAHLLVDDREAELIEYMCSFGLAKTFSEQFSHKYTLDEITKALQHLRTRAAQVVKARENALSAIHRESTP